MRNIRIQIIGPTGSGKSTIANLLRLQLEGNVAELEFLDDTPAMENYIPSYILGQGGLSSTKVSIVTTQTQRDPISEDIIPPDEILNLLGTCCDGGTAERIMAAREALDAYELLYKRNHEKPSPDA